MQDIDIHDGTTTLGTELHQILAVYLSNAAHTGIPGKPHQLFGITDDSFPEYSRKQ